MVGMDLTTVGWAAAALPATLLVGFAFGGLGLGVATLMRGWQDFDLLATVQLALFLFSGTFAPVGSAYPAPLRVLVEVSPLYQSVELVRGLTTGAPGPALLLHAAYLAAMAALGLFVAGRRMSRLLLR
jgi:lipooligosaccharide transport system permease protein